MTSTKHYPLMIEGDEGIVEIEVTAKKTATDLPEGSVQTSTPLDVAENLLRLKDHITVISEQVKAALADNPPEEWGVEFNIGFKTEGGIPFFAKGEANSTLKVSAKWKPNKNEQ